MLPKVVCTTTFLLHVCVIATVIETGLEHLQMNAEVTHVHTLVKHVPVTLWCAYVGVRVRVCVCVWVHGCVLCANACA